jgi:hypothetical protein
MPGKLATGSNRQKRCPNSSAISIGLRSRTVATIAERISHSHPALTVAGATRIEHHLWNLLRGGDLARKLFFLGEPVKAQNC